MSVAIETRGVTKSFKGKVAVDHVSLVVPVGAIYGFLGPNGAGKTTTIRMLLGLVRPDSGDVLMWGETPSWNSVSRLEDVGALVESPSLYRHLSGAENLDIARRLRRLPEDALLNALRSVRLTDVADIPVHEYSLGMRQRLGIACALLGTPRLLILDEPTNGLDPAGIREMRELLGELGRDGVTVFLSSHLLSEVAQLATLVGVVNHGRLVFEGPVDGLQAMQASHGRIVTDDNTSAALLLRQQGWRVDSDGPGVLLIASEGRPDLARANRLLVEHGIAIYHLSMEQPTLEESFLAITGVVTDVP